jgi:hypothetical protein
MRCKATCFLFFFCWLLLPGAGWTAPDVSSLVEPSRGIVVRVPTEEPQLGKLPIHERPNPESTVMGETQNGGEVVIEDHLGFWYKISAPVAGWVRTCFIKVTDTRPLKAVRVRKALTLEEVTFNADAGTDSTTPPPPPVVKEPVEYQNTYENMKRLFDLRPAGNPGR